MTEQPDGSVEGRLLSTQLEFEFDVALATPQLVVTVAQTCARTPSREPTGPSMSPLGSAGSPLGPVLAQVLEFHRAFALPREPLPTAPVGDVLAQLRVALLREETEEFAVATDKHDLVAIADALADVVYVAYGAAVTYGIDLDAVISEVHRSNMSKLDEDGRPVLRDDGKVLKSHRYRPPQIGAVLDDQLPLFDGCRADVGAAGLTG